MYYACGEGVNWLGRLGCDVGEWGLELYLSVFYGINQNVLF